MTTDKFCQVCLKPIEECIEADKQLIAPYDPRHHNKINVVLKERDFICLSYRLGCYDPATNTHYYYNSSVDISLRKINDIICSLSGCVRKYRYDLIRRDICIDNIYKLPMPKKYHNLLLYIFDIQHHYLIVVY